MQFKHAINLSKALTFLVVLGSRYPEFADYKGRSGLLLPRLFVSTTPDSEEATLAQKSG